MDEYEKHTKKIPSNVQIVLAPSLPDLMFFSNRYMDKKTHPQTFLGVQDISSFPAGAYTGAVCSRNLEGFHVSYAIIGHSERRRYFHETNGEVAGKIREALAASIIPVVCVTRDSILSQANAIETSDRKRVVVAFEPIDHIGTGIADTLEDILEARKLVKEAFGDVPYIYGGSIDTKTDTELLNHKDIDGFLVGNACLNAEAFAQLIQLIQ